MLILGIDPGLQNTGWGIISLVGHSTKFVGCGTIKTSSGDPLAARLCHIHTSLVDVIETHQPDRAAVEETFVNKNPASALKLGQARGVALSVPAILGVPVAEYTANQVKKAIVGRGHAAKQQMGMMIRTILPAARNAKGDFPSHDEADALAVAVCHAHHANVAYAFPAQAGISQKGA